MFRGNFRVDRDTGGCICRQSKVFASLCSYPVVGEMSYDVDRSGSVSMSLCVHGVHRAGSLNNG